MSPVTHLLASWVVAAGATDNERDRCIVAWAGLAPDLDGLGLIADIATADSAHSTDWYPQYHHFLLHGIFAAIACACVAAWLGRRRLRVALLVLIVFHLHLICDLVGSRGPSPEDLWPIFYFGPITKEPMWLWHGQWPLDAWPNRLISVVLLIASFVIAERKGFSIVGLFSRRGDRVFVSTLRKWSGRAG